MNNLEDPNIENMEWFSQFFRRYGKQPRSRRVTVTEARFPIRTPAMERAAVLSREEWVAEHLRQTPITQLMAIRGIKPAHVQTLQNSGIQNLLQLREAPKWPLLGSSKDLVREWLDGFIADLGLEYAQLRNVVSKAA